jgi:PKD repeat protein
MMRPHRKSLVSACILGMVFAVLASTIPVGAYPNPTPTPTPTPGWYDCGWGYRQSITIDHTKVSGSLTNFPVLISLASDPDLASHARADGYDILFTSADGTTKISHEIESFKNSTGALVAWVKVPTLSSSSNTVLYMYYGNPGASSQQNPTAVWDSKFAGAWHLNNGLTDSTSNSNNGVNYGSTDTTGQIANARNFDGRSNYLSLGTGTTLQPAELTVSFWVKRTASWDNTRKYLIWAKGTRGAMETTNGWYLDTYDIGKRNTPINLVVDGMNGFNGPFADPDTYYPLNEWTQIVVTFSSATNDAAFYRNGVSQASNEWGDPESITSTSDPKTLAYANGTYVPAAFDEVRISSTVRSSQWIQTEYNNENSPSTFSSLQAIEKVADHSTCRIPTPPVAGFAADVTTGKAPLTVTFTDQSTNTPTSWSWEFGDGGTSSLQNPVHTYTAAGTYTVKLTASNGDGSNAQAKSSYITVNPKTLPVAGFAADVTTGKAPLTVTFTDKSTNTPTSWSWDFGDGGTSGLQNPVHVYTAAGTYTVKLTASNGDGSDAMVKQDFITVNPKTLPVAGFTTDVSSGKAPLTVTFTDKSTNTPTSWSWDFGDSGTSSLQNPVHVYTAAGTYTVKLTDRKSVV